VSQRALISGGAGFIGSHVTELLLSDGWSVDVLDDFSTGKRSNVPEGVTVHELAVQSRETNHLLREGAYDVVVHLAAQMDVRKSVADPLFDATTNILGTVNVAEGIRASRRKTRLLFASTGGVLYGDFVTPPNDETFPKDPESPYAIAKLSAEHYLAYYARVHGLDAVSLRFGNVYGPRQDPHGEAGVVAIFCRRVLEEKPLTIYGTGEQTRDYVYVRDVAHATRVAATAQLPPQERLDSRSFNIGTGIGTSVNVLAETLLSVANRRVPIEYAPSRAGEQEHSFVNVTKAARLLHWMPSVSLEAGLEQTFAWFQQRWSSGSGRSDRESTAGRPPLQEPSRNG
jgi:UDP-glucose 4-epimerase